MDSPAMSGNGRASLSVVFGLAGLLAIPAAVVLSRESAAVGLLDAVWAVPVAAVFSLAALLFARGARGKIRSSLERARGASRIRTGLVLGVAGLCITCSSAIAYGFYELLLHLEK